MAKEQTSKGKTVEKAAGTAAVPKEKLPQVPNAEGPMLGGAKNAKKLIPDIIRGRMPILVVHMVRFGENKNEKTGALAKMFGTTEGKIADIVRKSTFGYLPEGFKPNQAHKDEAIAWLKRHVGYKDGAVDKLINEAEGYKLATAEEAASYEALRIQHRGQTPTTKKGETADGGGGNRVKAAKTAAPKEAPKADKPQAEKPKAKDLL